MDTNKIVSKLVVNIMMLEKIKAYHLNNVNFFLYVQIIKQKV